jgi:hypothetical protein
VTFYTLFVSAKCDTLEKEVEKIILTTIKNKVKHPKACFTIEYHLCHIDDQSILAAIVLWRPKNFSRQFLSLQKKIVSHTLLSL